LVRVTIFLAGEQVRRGNQGDDVGHCEEAQPTRQSSSILSPFTAALTQ